jgi:hypothetical protein
VPSSVLCAGDKMNEDGATALVQFRVPGLGHLDIALDVTASAVVEICTIGYTGADGRQQSQWVRES